MDNYQISNIGQNNLANADTWKALWNRPGGTMAKITAVAAACGIGYGFVKALPFLMAAAANTLIFIGELVAIAGIVMVLTSKSFWKWISLFWLQLNRKVLSIFVKIDPISILKNGIARMKSQLEDVESNITKLGGILVQMKRDLKNYESEFQLNKSRREAAQKKMANQKLSQEELLAVKSNYVVINNDIARLSQIITNQQKRIAVSEKYLAVMKKLKTLATFKVKDAESELRFRAAEYEQAKKQQSAIKSIKQIFSGGLGKTMEEEMALEFCAETVNNSIAEMQSLLDGSSDLLVNMDLDSYANIEKVDKILDNFEKNGFASFNEQPSNVSEQPYNPVQNALPDNTAGTINVSDMMMNQEKVLVENKYF